MPPDYHGLPTPRSTLRDDSACVLVWCKACRHQAEAPLPMLVDTGRGDVPLTADERDNRARQLSIIRGSWDFWPERRFRNQH
jgi:hypothetical protein